MPELPEVETIKRQLLKKVVGPPTGEASPPSTFVFGEASKAIFIEHVASQHKFINAILKTWNPAQKAIVGCDLQRHTGNLIRQSGLKLIKEENIKLKDVFRYFEAIKI